MKPEEIQNLHKSKENNLVDKSPCKQVTNEAFSLIKNDHLHEAINVMKNRLPRCAHVYNMALMACKFPSIKVYSLNGDLSEKGIFLLTDYRQDFGQDFNISVPWDFKVSEGVKQAFINTTIIDWNSKYIFTATDSLVSPMIMEISTIHKRNSTLTNPVYYYFMGQEEAANLDINVKPEVEVKAMTSGANGGTDFLLKGWKWTQAGTEEYVKEVIENGITSAIYVDRVPVCGIIENRNGILGMLFTAKDHRNKGYAKMCTQYLMKQLGMNGYVVASAVESHNTASSEFHKKTGMIEAGNCDDILFEKLGFEAK